LIDVNEEFRRNFQIEIDDTSILKHWSIFDLRTDFNPIDFRWRICEYQKWSDFFYQIQSLIRFSKYIVDDIHNINDFLDVFEHCLNSDLSLRDIIGYNRRNEVATCYLMYAKLLRPSLFVILAKETRKLGGNMGKMVDYIQNYELAT
jgi:hypothetical protein